MSGEQKQLQRQELIKNIMLLLNNFLFKNVYGPYVLSQEIFVFDKFIQNLDITVDSSKHIQISNQKILRSNMLQQSSLQLKTETYAELNFNVSIPLVQQQLKEYKIASIEQFIAEMVEFTEEIIKSKKQIFEDFSQRSNKNNCIFQEQKQTETLYETLCLFVNTYNLSIITPSRNLPINNTPITAQYIIGKNRKTIYLTKRTGKQQEIILKAVLATFRLSVLLGINFQQSQQLKILCGFEIVDIDIFSEVSSQVIHLYCSRMLEAMSHILDSFKNFQIYLKSEHGIETIQLKDESELMKKLVGNLKDYFYRKNYFFDNYFNAFLSQIRCYLSHVDVILKYKMLGFMHKYKEITDQQQANQMWISEEKVQKKLITDRLKDNWIGDNQLLVRLFESFFEVVFLNLQICQINEDYFPYTFRRLELGLQSFVRVYKAFFIKNETSESHISNGDDDQIDEHFCLPSLKRVLTKPENEKEMMKNESSKGQTDYQSLVIANKSIKRRNSQSNELIFNKLYNLMKENMLSIILQFEEQNVWIDFINDTKSYMNNNNLDLKMKFITALTTREAKKRERVGRYYGSKEIKVDRNSFWFSFLEEFITINPSNLAVMEIDISYLDEDGYDAGGLSKEFFSKTMKELIDPSFGLFSISANGITVQPSPTSDVVPDHLFHFKYAGRFIAKAMLLGFCPEIDFTRSLLKHLVGDNLYISDLEDIDPELEQNLLWMLENDVSSLCMDFTYSYWTFGQQKLVELKKEGSQIEVNDDNKKEYVKLVAQYRMTTQIEKQIKAIATGFYEVIPFKILKNLSFQELGLILSGHHFIDTGEMKKHMNYSQYNEESIQIKWFYEIQEEYTQKQRSEFLFFLTGSYRLPYGGFNSHPLTIEKISDKNSLPISHTCSKRLELPTYDSKEIMKDKLEYAILEGSLGFFIG